jgi:type II secretory pathway component GspD/PulD (secretin)
MRATLGWTALLVTAALLAGAVEIKRPVDMGFVPLRAMSYDEAVEICAPLLSKDGKFTYARVKNLLVIHDYLENIEAIRKLVAEVDEDPVNIRVDIFMDETAQAQASNLDVHLRNVQIQRRNGHTRVGGTVGVNVGAGSRDTSSTTNPFVMAGNGRPARIWVGETVADPVWVYDYGRGHGWWKQELVDRDLGVSLWVLPRLLPNDCVEIEVYPRITARGATPFSVNVKELGTKVVVRNGAIMPLGGLDSGHRDAYRRILGIGSVFNGSNLAISVRPTIMRMPERLNPEKPRQVPPDRKP